MIFYFSATGNSYSIAKKLAKELNDNLISIPEAINTNQYTYQLQHNETVGFVYPIHAWIPPKIVLMFASKLNLLNYNKHYIYSVFTFAGSNEGAWDALSHQLKKSKFILSGDFEILMPGNYLLGDNRLTAEENTRRLNSTDEQIMKMTHIISNREYNHVKTHYSFIKHHIVSKLFALSSGNTPFLVNEKCIGCKQCTQICPTQAISFKNHVASRNNKDCISCMACINRCPVEAIDFSEKTKGVKRYVHPIFKNKIL